MAVLASFALLAGVVRLSWTLDGAHHARDWRMVPLGPTFRPHTRTVRDLAADLASRPRSIVKVGPFDPRGEQ